MSLADITPERDDAPSVSIVIPAYNCESTIGVAIESCINQFGVECEIVVVNDGSTDSTSVVLSRFGSRIRVVNQPNGGLANARNAGNEIANGELIVWMDADDIAAHDRVVTQMHVMMKYPDVALVFSDFDAFADGDQDDAARDQQSYMGTYYGAVRDKARLEQHFQNRSTPETISRASNEKSRLRRGRIREALLRGNFVHPPTVMVRKSVAQQVGKFDESLKSGSDYDFILRAARFGEFAMVDASLLRYRLSEKQMSSGFQNSVTMTENAAILIKLERDDPQFFRANRPLILRRISESLLAAAYDLTDRNKLQAFGHVAQSIHTCLLPLPTAKVAFRLLIPRMGLDVARSVRAKLASA